MRSQTTPDKQMPHDADAEEALLGCLLIDPEGVARIGAILRPEDFYRERHGMIFQTMLELHERDGKSDFVSLCGELERSGKTADVGGASYLAQLVNATPSAVYAPHYAKRIEHCAALRRIIMAAGKLAARAYEQPVDVDELLQVAETDLYAVRQRRLIGRIITPLDRSKAAFGRYQRRDSGERCGIGYGLLALDKWTQGAEPGQLILIAGRPAMGKSSLLQNLAEKMATSGKRILFASAEMTEAQLTDRFVAAELDVSVHHLQEGGYSADTWAGIDKALAMLSEHSWYAVDESDLTTGGLRSRAIEMRGKHGLDAIFVDYLQILHDKSRGSEVERVTAISRELKRLARTLAVPVIAAAQLSRATEHRDNKRPQLSDLRESGALEQDADMVAFIYRKGYYSGDLHDNSAELIIAKQRNGPAGISSPLWFDRRRMRFYDAAKES